MTTASQIESEIKNDRQPVRIEISTKGKWTSADDVLIYVKRIKGHPNCDLIGRWGKKKVERRQMPDECLTVQGAQSGTKKTYEWKPHWEFSSTTHVTNDLEIYGVLRAEYRFFQWGWQKVNSKMGNHGIDSLFKKGNNFAICESKAGGSASAVGQYVGYLQMHSSELHGEGDWERVKRKRNVVKERLKDTGVRLSNIGLTFPNHGTELKIMEMTTRWVDVKIGQMIRQSNDLRRTGQQLVKTRKKGRAFRYFNFYAAKPLFALPGVYQVYRYVVGDQSGDSKKKKVYDCPEKQFDWPDRCNRLDKEFIWLDVHEPFLEMENENNTQIEEVRAQQETMGSADVL